MLRNHTDFTNKLLTEPTPDMPVVNSAATYCYTRLAAVESEHLHKNIPTVDTRHQIATIKE